MGAGGNIPPGYLISGGLNERSGGSNRRLTGSSRGIYIFKVMDMPLSCGRRLTGHVDDVEIGDADDNQDVDPGGNGLGG